MNGTQVRNLRPLRAGLECQQTAPARPGGVHLSELQRARKARRAARRRRQKIIAVIVLWTAEIVGASLAGAIAAAILLPLAYAERGGFAYGGEWLLIFCVAMLAYHLIHRAVFKRLEKREEGNPNV